MSRMLRALWIGVLCGVAPVSASQIEGRVINAANGQGVSGAKVHIFQGGGPSANDYAVTADPEGRFRIADVKEGAYRAMYAAPGFESIPDAGAMPELFAVPAGDRPLRLEVKMTPLARISGRVLDADGKPVPNAGIWLVAGEKWCMPPGCSPDHRLSTSGDEGEFAFADLRPGPWLVAATAPASSNPPQPRGEERLGWAQSFYPGVADPAAAPVVMLWPGGDQSNVVIKLAAAPVHRIHGKLLDPDGAPVPHAAINLAKGFGPDITEQTGSDGTFDFDPVLEGRWLASAEVVRDGVKLRAAETIELNHRDLERVTLRLTAPFVLHGTIVLEIPDGAPVAQRPGIDIVLDPQVEVLDWRPQYLRLQAAQVAARAQGGRLHYQLAQSDGPTKTLVVRSDGNSLEARNVYPGLYAVHFLTDSPAPYYLDSIHLGEQEALGSFAVVSGELPLTITLKQGGGTVRGTVEGCGSHRVFLVPQERSRRRDGFIRIAACDANGRFEFAAVRPGDYYGLATTREPQSFIALSDERTLQQAAKLTVRPDETTSADIELTGR